MYTNLNPDLTEIKYCNPLWRGIANWAKFFSSYASKRTSHQTLGGLQELYSTPLYNASILSFLHVPSCGFCTSIASVQDSVFVKRLKSATIVVDSYLRRTSYGTMVQKSKILKATISDRKLQSHQRNNFINWLFIRRDHLILEIAIYERLKARSIYILKQGHTWNDVWVLIQLMASQTTVKLSKDCIQFGFWQCGAVHAHI